MNDSHVYYQFKVFRIIHMLLYPISIRQTTNSAEPMFIKVVDFIQQQLDQVDRLSHAWDCNLRMSLFEWQHEKSDTHTHTKKTQSLLIDVARMSRRVWMIKTTGSDDDREKKWIYAFDASDDSSKMSCER